MILLFMDEGWGASVSASSARPLRRALFEKGANPLLSVRVQHVLDHHSRRLFVGFGEAHSGLGVDRLLAEPDRMRRLGSDDVCTIGDGFAEGLARDDAVHQAEFK